ncbi:DUF4855 domain-containing protein [Paenibacillus marinisediminis]
MLIVGLFPLHVSAADNIVEGVSASADYGTSTTQKSYGEEQNLALGKKAELILTGLGTSPHPTDSSLSVNEVETQIVDRITDGQTASTAEFEDGWVGKPWNGNGARSLYLENYRNIGREINIDLGQISNITELSLHAGYHSGYGIEFPVGLTYYLSEDGEEYYKVGEVRGDEVIHDSQKPTGSDPMDHVFYELSGLNYNARYVKIYYEVGVWAFIDEVYVMGTPESVANADDFTTGDPFLPAIKKNKYAFTDQSQGIQHEMLIYSGWDYSQQPTYKTVDDLIRTITYVDKDGQIKDWLFDSLTFLPHPTLDSEGKMPLYVDGTPPENYSGQSGWLKYIEHTLHGPDGDDPYNLDALDIAAGQAKEALNDPNKKIGVKMTILPPVHVKDNWGVIDGKQIDFTPEASGGNEQAIENRRAAVEWYVNKAIELFEAQHYKNITLDGFYYYDEVIYESLDPLAAATIQEITKVVKDTGKQIYWIPLFQAQGFHKWESFGFDYAIMQPNYAFSKEANTSRLTESAELSKMYGLGVEMELGGAAETDFLYLTKFKEYLDRGSASDLGYQNSSLIGWYMSTNALVDLSYNVNNTRYLYDAIYQFVKGKDIDFSDAISVGKPVSLSYRDANLVKQAEWDKAVERAHYLTDGKYAVSDRDKHPELNQGYFDDPAVMYDVTLDLEENYNLSALTMSFTGWSEAGVNGSSEVTFSISPDGVNWTQVGVVTSSEAQVVPAVSGMEILNYTYSPPKELEARYIRASFGHSNTWWLFLEEISGVGEKSEVNVDPPTVQLLEPISPNDIAEGSDVMIKVKATQDAQILVKEQGSIIAQAVGAGETPVKIVVPTPSAGVHNYEITSTIPGIGSSEAVKVPTIKVHAFDGIQLNAIQVQLKPGDMHEVVTSAVYGPLKFDVSSWTTLEAQKPQIVAVAGNKLVALQEGTSVVTATFSGITMELLVSVNSTVVPTPELNSIKLTLQSNSIKVGESVQASVYAEYQLGDVITGVNLVDGVELTATSEGIAQVNGFTIQGVKAGETVVLAVYGGKTSSAPLKVVNKEQPSTPPNNESDEDQVKDEPGKQNVTEDELKPQAGNKVTIQMKDGSTEILLPANAAQVLKDGVLEVTRQEGSLIIPNEVFADMLAALKLDVKQVANFSISFKSQADGKGVDLQLAILDKDGRAHVYESFAKPVQLQLTVEAGQDTRLSGIYAIGADGKETFVGGKRAGNNLTASITSGGIYELKEWKGTFTDVPDKHWANMAIRTLNAKHIVNGVDANSYNPNGKLTRAEFTALVARIFELKPASQPTGFSDVPADAWYRDALAAAVAAGVTTGVTADKFDPNAPITREQMALMLARAAGALSNSSDQGSELTFKDADSISPWAREAVAIAVKHGWMNGKQNGIFDAQAQATRAECAMMLYNMFESQF